MHLRIRTLKHGIFASWLIWIMTCCTKLPTEFDIGQFNTRKHNHRNLRNTSRTSHVPGRICSTSNSSVNWDFWSSSWLFLQTFVIKNIFLDLAVSERTLQCSSSSRTWTVLQSSGSPRHLLTIGWTCSCHAYRSQQIKTKVCDKTALRNSFFNKS